MKNIFIVLSLALLLGFFVGCQDKDEMTPPIQIEKKKMELSDDERIEISEKVKKLALECAEVFSTLEQEPYMNFYLDSNRFTFVMNGQTTRSFAAFYELVKSSLNNLQEAHVEYTNIYADVYSREFAVVHGPFKWSAVYQDGKHEEAMGHMSFVYILHKGEWKIAFASEHFSSEGDEG